MSGSSPAVSIVLATHNRSEWLRRAMDSVLEQDHPDLELLVMDDGSSDGTPELLRAYAERHPRERFRFFRHHNMGQARTLNRGYELARGDILGYLSDDDMLAPGAVSRLVSALDDPELVAVYPGYRIIDEAGEVIDTVRPVPYSPLESFRRVDTVIGPGCLVRRDALLSTGGWDPELRFMGDFVLWIKVGLAGRVARLPEPLASWRRHGGGLSLQVAAAHGRELMSLIGVAERLLELPADGAAIRAEALRNACVQAAFFGGGGDSTLGERYATVDLSKGETSAVAAGLPPTEVPDERVDRVGALWHELAGAATELARARRGAEAAAGEAAGAGLAAARDRLLRAGAVPERPGGGDSWGRDDLREELLAAAVECGRDVDPAESRYLVLERGAGVTDAEFDEINRLGYSASAEELERAIAARRAELAALGGLPSGGDR
jgi:hypothetical protein